jgi:aryl-alcohol dehydrogenase-like predicted oxidoreductase
VSLQTNYNLIERAEFERELQALCIEEGVGVLPYTPLAKGFLAGGYRRDQPASLSPRAPGVAKLYQHEIGWAVLDAVRCVAEQQNASPAQISLAWLLHRDGITAPVVGVSSPAQLKDVLGAANIRLHSEALALLESTTPPAA